MKDKPWPVESQDKAVELLPRELRRLQDELGLFIEHLPQPLINRRIEYNDDLGRLFHRLGRCEVIAEIAESKVFPVVISRIISVLQDLLDEPTLYSFNVDHLREAHFALIDEYTWLTFNDED